MEKNYVCYQYQCPNHPRCALAGGTCCAIELDHRKTPVTEELCREAVKQWMKDPYGQR